jgi:glucosamine-phosphate N-acetyltransferase
MAEYIIRRLVKSDYNKGIIELLGQLTSISKDKISQKQFDEYVNNLSSNDNHFTIVVEEPTNNSTTNCNATMFQPGVQKGFESNPKPDQGGSISPIEAKIIGTATLLIEPKLIHNISKVGHIEDVVVDKNYRSHGIGKLMLDNLKNKAELMDCYKVILDCDEKNVGFYVKCGFKTKGVEMACYFE